MAYPLCAKRVHEACGAASVSFALRTAAQMDSDFLWVREHWITEKVNPQGLDGVDPSRLLNAQTKDQTDTLAVAEEALRDGSLRLVVLQITAPITFTAGRRLQLAAKAGGTTGLCLIPKDMGSNVAETRWDCAPVFDPKDSTLQRWKLTKNKSGTLGSWHVRWDAEMRRIAVVSPPRE